MFKLGLTGSIGMGKSTTARLFAEEGCDVWDADAAVHRLYGKSGAAVGPVSAEFPDVVLDGAIDRRLLREAISKDPSVLARIEKIVHPLVGRDRAEFVARSTSDICVFDIPLLFETGGDAAVDAVVCVTVDPDTQEQRVLERGTMTADQFRLIRDKQMPNDEKCARADFVVVTDTPEHARQQVREIVQQIRGRLNA